MSGATTTLLKRGVRLLGKGIAWVFRPLQTCFGWSVSWRLSATQTVVLLPDATAAFLVMLSCMWLITTFGGWQLFYAALAAVALSPCLLNAVVVSEQGVYVFRLFAFIPYWRHSVPATATFELSEGWEDPAPTGVAFDATPYGRDPLHLGTSTSAEKLFAQVGTLLEAVGWQRGTFGYTLPIAVKIPGDA